MGQLVNEVDGIIKNRAAGKEIKTERRKILDQMASDEAAKTNLVKKALARQRAIYGASGMTGRGMTEEAVLKRIREEEETPFDTKRKSNQDRLAKLKKPKKTNLLKSLAGEFTKIMG
ncbi:MAG: hypothetical protein FWF34_00700 [Alphaproteobacteria bacterium]|nr:hypothetical protein [Alphaproteobacteria bacterium]MCL2889765.1 hypothetical protein [Alphaproteobacteria bacterium]